MNSIAKNLELNVLDQSPVVTGSTPAQALENSIALAKLVDRLGYGRFWMSEHHAMETLACTAPEIMLSRIGAETRRIHIGSGGIMLPHYSAFKVAEVFRMLHALYPGRVDLGIGRAPGGGPLESYALRRDRETRMPDDFSDQLAELLAFLGHGFPPQHPFSRLTVSPEMPGSPEVWLLGSSQWSGEVAAKCGLPYAFAHFFSPEPTRRAIEHYLRNFEPGSYGDRPRVMAAVGVICADTDQEAEYLASSVRVLQRRIRQGDRRPVPSPVEALRELGPLSYSPAEETGEWPRYFIGTPERVRDAMENMAGALSLDGFVVNTIVHDQAARLRSYELLAEAFQIGTDADMPRTQGIAA